MFRDLGYSLRALRRNRSFTLVAILSIALGVGANTVIFSLADALLFRPLPVPDAGRVVNVRSQLRGQPPFDMSYPDFVDFRQKSGSFESMTAFDFAQFGFATAKTALPEMKAGLLVSGNFFDVLHVTPLLGRGFRADEDAVPGRDAVAVISHDVWRSEFASSADVIGRPLFVNGIPFRIVGVAPESFTGVDQFFRPSIYIPLAMMGPLQGDPAPYRTLLRSDRRFTVKARLKPGVGRDAANAEARVLAGVLAKSYPDTNHDWSASVRSEVQMRTDQSPFDAVIVGLLLGLAGVVLLIACANVGNLMLGRALSRSGEIAIRMAVGASRWRLVRQLLSESLLLSLVSGAVGLSLARLCMDAFLPWRIPAQFPVEISARLDSRVALFALCVSVASALLCGLLPALRATRTDIEPALRAGGRNSEPRRRFLGRNVLVAAQIGASLFLLVCASQFYRATAFVIHRPVGFRTDHVLMASFNPALARHNEVDSQEFYKRLTDRGGQLPGVVSASMAEVVPFSPMPDQQLIVPEGYRLPAGQDSLSVLANVVSDDYFRTLDIPIVKGRGFQPGDTKDTPPVAVVNEQFARLYFPGGDPLGKRFRLGGPDGRWVQVAGVARMSKYIIAFEPPMPFFYLPLRQNHRPSMTLLLHTAAPSRTLAAPLRELVRSLDSGQPIFALRTMEEYFEERSTKLLLVLEGLVGGMGLLGLFLALSGLYAVMAWSVARRRREIGIRIAVGAGRGSVLSMVLRQGIRLSLVGLTGGMALSLLFGKVLTAGAGVPSFHVPTLIVVALSLLAMTALGAYIPARRASRVDPITVLRQD